MRLHAKYGNGASASRRSPCVSSRRPYGTLAPYSHATRFALRDLNYSVPSLLLNVTSPIDTPPLPRRFLLSTCSNCTPSSP
eukprot:2177935-Pleurochrysis_carterae.AAC.1